MFALVGRAISGWSMVELSLCNIFTICVTSCPSRSQLDGGFVSFLDGDVPCAVFYSVENFRGKLGLVDAALNTRIRGHGQWAQDIRAEWAKLHNKTRKLSLKRNHLAHWTVIPAMPDDDERSYPAKLMPPYGSPGWWAETSINPPGNAKSASQLNHLVLAFSLIDEKLRAFSKMLAQHPRLTDKYDKLTVRLIRSHDRLSPTRGEAIRRALSSPEKH